MTGKGCLVIHRLRNGMNRGIRSGLTSSEQQQQPPPPRNNGQEESRSDQLAAQQQQQEEARTSLSSATATAASHEHHIEVAHMRQITDETQDHTDESDSTSFSSDCSSFMSNESLDDDPTASHNLPNRQQQQQQQQQPETQLVQNAQQIAPKNAPQTAVARLPPPATAALATRETSDQNTTTEEEAKKAQHETSTETEMTLDAEIAVYWERNRRMLLGRLHETAPKGRLSLINLSRRGLSVNEARLLQQAIVANPHLSVLKLSYNELGDVGTALIAEALGNNGKHHDKLSVLDLGFNEVGNAGCEALAVHALAGNDTLETLYLSGNRISEKGAFSIAGAILHGCGLNKLHLSANRIGPMGMKAIAGAIAKNDARIADLVGGRSGAMKRMIELHVENAGIGSEGFIAIPGMLLSNTTLRFLSVTNNGLDDQDMMLLSQALSQNKKVPLERLQFSFNQLTDQGVECLMNAVWGSETLRELKLDNNLIQDRGAQLCAVVLTSIPLEILDLSFNKVTTVGIKALMKNVSENQSLKTLGVSGIPIDLHASKAVSYALAYNTSLNVIYMDNCSAGYSAQRHIAAGVVSNRRASLRVLTGFALAPITMTLGMPQIPEQWSNEQVLGFVRLMWQQWLFKTGHGNMQDAMSIRGPAPPAAVATAAKIAFTSLGGSPKTQFRLETHDRPIPERVPVDSASSALLERTNSGTLVVPSFSEAVGGELTEWIDRQSKVRNTPPSGSPSALTMHPLEDPDRRNRNLQWLRTHFRSLSEVGRLPFNNADLWQLHQYYFSPPVYPLHEQERNKAEGEVEMEAAMARSETPDAPPPTLAVKAQSSPVGRTVSFRSLGDAFASSGLVPSMSTHSNKRPPEADAKGPAWKRAKNLQPRVAFYPRLMAKIQSLSSRPMDQTLSLLRQLKYTENVMFTDKNAYDDFTSPGSIHADIEMILVDLL